MLPEIPPYTSSLTKMSPILFIPDYIKCAETSLEKVISFRIFMLNKILIYVWRTYKIHAFFFRNLATVPLTGIFLFLATISLPYATPSKLTYYLKS